MRAVRRWWAAVAAVTAIAGAGACRQVLGFQPAVEETCKPGATQPCQGTGTQTCSEDGTGWGACVVPPECTAQNVATACDDKNACTVDSCDAMGKCQHALGMAGVACGMGGSCDAAGQCLDGGIVWNRLYGDTGDAALFGLAVDGQGNIFVGGTFKNTITLGGMPLSAKSNFGDAFLAKLNPDGTTAWAKSFGSVMGGASTVQMLAADASGSVTASIELPQDVDAGCGPLAVPGAYVAQYDGNGACLWGHVFSASGGELGLRALTIDPASTDVVVTGEFSGSVDFGTSSGSLIASGSDIFVVRLRSGQVTMNGGSVAWATQLGGMASTYRNPSSIAVRPDGFISIVGQIAGAGTGNDALYATVDSSGNVYNVKTYGNGNDQQLPKAVIADPGGNILFVGYSTGSIDFGGGALKTSGTADKSTFLAKFTPDILVYAKEWGDASADFAASLAADKDSNIVLVGATLGTINFGGADLVNMGQALLYLAKLTPAAKNIWSKGFGDTMTSLVFDPRVAVDPKTQQVILGATFTGPLDLGKGKLTATGQNFVVAKFNP